MAGFGSIHLFQEMSTNGANDLVVAMERIIMRKLAKVRQWFELGKVVVELECTEIKLNSAAVDKIKSLKPYTMSWSNLCDYFKPETFHKLVLACSDYETVHYGHSMNWVTEVYGTNLMDYPDHKTKVTILDTTNACQKDWGGMIGMDRMLVFPLHCNPLNPTTQVLAKRYAKNWSDHFFSEKKANTPVHFFHEEMCTISFDPLLAGAGTARLVWTYNQELEFHDSNNPDRLVKGENY